MNLHYRPGEPRRTRFALGDKEVSLAGDKEVSLAGDKEVSLAGGEEVSLAGDKKMLLAGDVEVSLADRLSFNPGLSRLAILINPILSIIRL